MSKQKDSLCDEAQFDAFYSDHARSLRNFIFYKFGDAEQSDDVVQESFIRLWKNCAKVTMETAKGFLYKVAINLSTSLKRSEKVRLNYRQQAVKTETNQESPEYVMLEKEFMDKLSEAISSLPDKQREVFLMNRVEKKTYKEIAELSGVSVKAIEKSMHKALLKLRAKIGNV
ncbi:MULTISPECIES: sigma-70 family RNA polymerase sigma factor [unclassified Ekhidna]|jgi:RNA polymerase sigma-70 factor (family 1)|uniref:RNA polymerase sigma factor n=1 Tax=unclassified Ekhidna TaxID=2632188 RepID=UPI0032E0566F